MEACEAHQELRDWIKWRTEEVNDPNFEKTIASLRGVFTDAQLNTLLCFFASQKFYNVMKLSGELGDYLTALADTLS